MKTIKLPEYTETIHERLMNVLNTLDPAFIANENANEYYDIAGYALTADENLDLISAVNNSLIESVGDKYVLTPEQEEFLIENF